MRLGVTVKSNVDVAVEYNSLNHVGRFHDHVICQLYYVKPPNKVRICVCYSYIQAYTWKFRGVILPTFTRIVVHPDIIHMKNCSSQYYSMKILTLLTIFLLFIPTLFIICTDVIFSLYYKFIPMKVR
jgi:hypothetical protein